MKNSIKRFIPGWLLGWYRNRNTNSRKFRNKSAKDVFTEIYESNHWESSESKSGTGSEFIKTESLIKGIDKLLIEMNIKSVLDLPCGDYEWMQKVDMSNINYIGADIVEALIEDNIKQYKETEKRKFKVLNIITDPLPKCDLIIVRDCFVHLSYDDINSAIQNIKASGSKYLLTTTFTKHNQNHDIVTGNWRALNLLEKPFNFSPPMTVLVENCTEGSGIYTDKAMALWEISKI